MNKKQRPAALLCVFCVALTLLVSVLCYRGGAVNYHNADATWHVLLTMQAYDETPAAAHRFVPLVSLGRWDDKNIPWGDTVFAADGNAYYVSFSAAAYVAPWVFCRVLGLPYTEASLYLFGRCVLLASLLLLCALLWDVFGAHPAAPWLCALGALVYTLEPEILHGTGMVYWHQSLYQLLFLGQLLAYRRKGRSRAAGVWFFALCVLGPYVEWTGYVANAGFMLAALLDGWQAKRRAVRTMAGIAGATVLGGALFVAHDAWVLGLGPVLQMLQKRFFARSVSASMAYTFKQLIAGYLRSFGFMWLAAALLAGALAVCWLRGRQARPTPAQCRPYAGLAVCLCAPLGENVLMMRHAVDYTYDRMKLVFPLVFAVCALAALLLKSRPGRAVLGGVLAITLAAGLANLQLYRQADSRYVWDAPFRETNTRLAALLEPYRDTALLVTQTEVRGYLNLLLHRGIYEYAFDPDRIVARAVEQGKPYIIYLWPVENAASGNGLYAYTWAELHEVETGEISRIELEG